MDIKPLLYRIRSDVKETVVFTVKTSSLFGSLMQKWLQPVMFQLNTTKAIVLFIM